MSPLTGQSRNGRICVATFMPPDAFARYEVWKQANLDRFGPLEDWEVGIGRATGGRDLVAVWVPEQHAPAPR